MADERTDRQDLILAKSIMPLYPLSGASVLPEERLLELDKCDRCGPFFRYNSRPDGVFRGQAGLADEKFLMDRMLGNNHLRTCKIFNGHKPREGNGAPKGRFAFTLTKSPTDPFTIEDMLNAVRKIMKQKSCPVAEYAWYYEDKGKDDNGIPIHPHIHGMYETHTQGRIESKHFKRAWSIWGENDPSKRMGQGFRGGYHRPVRSDEAYNNYIKKDQGYCEYSIEDVPEV